MAAKRACLKLVSDVLTKEEMRSTSQIGPKSYTNMRTDLKENSFKLQPEARGRHALYELDQTSINTKMVSDLQIYTDHDVWDYPD